MHESIANKPQYVELFFFHFRKTFNSFRKYYLTYWHLSAKQANVSVIETFALGESMLQLVVVCLHCVFSMAVQTHIVWLPYLR